MPLSWLPTIRIIFLVAAITAFLQATVLNGWVQRNILDRWVAFGERVTQVQSTRPFPDPRIARIFPLFMAVLFVAVWWFLGTATGVDWAREHLAPRR